MAKLVFYSSDILVGSFKKETGMNISHYITLYRIQKAKELLRDLQNKVYDIAYQTGFNDARYFSRGF
ncbi:MAG: helix-turn-helix transcriptional regulator [Waltera sp.]